LFLGSKLEVVRTENLTQAECTAKLEEVLCVRLCLSARQRGMARPP
jgi:hypothetical protein